MADRMAFGDKQQMTEHEKRNLALQKEAMNKRNQKNIKKYGSIDNIRKARMAKYIKNGWVKSTDATIT